MREKSLDSVVQPAEYYYIKVSGLEIIHLQLETEKKNFGTKATRKVKIIMSDLTLDIVIERYTQNVCFKPLYSA
jgi:hypothetical protein